MSRLKFYSIMAVLIPAMAAEMYTVIDIVADEFRAGHRKIGFTMIATVVVMVGTALPLYVL